MKQHEFTVAILFSIFVGCGAPTSGIFGSAGAGSSGPFGDSESSVASGSGGSSSGSESSSTAGPGGSDPAGVGGSSSNSSSSTGCVPNDCPNSYYCGDWDDGCGNVVQCKQCSDGDTCGSDHLCHACVPTQTPAVVCKPGSCGHYVDDCGHTQTCVPDPDDGNFGCPDYLWCTNGDLPYVPYVSPTPDWTAVGTCTGCRRSFANDALCGTSGDAYACPVAFANQVQDMTETDVDCGGFNPAKCEVGKACVQDSDCLENRCTGGVCANTAFSNPGCLNLKVVNVSGDIMCCP